MSSRGLRAPVGVLCALALAIPTFGAVPAPAPSASDVVAWSRLLDAEPSPPTGEGPSLARSLGQTAYSALLGGLPGLAEAAFGRLFAGAPDLRAEEADLYFAAAWTLYDDCSRRREHGPFILLYLEIAAKKGSRRMAAMEDLVRVVRADLASIEDIETAREPPSAERLRDVVKGSGEEYRQALDRARYDTTVVDMRSLAAALEAWAKKHGRLPDGDPAAVIAKLSSPRGGKLQGFDAWGTRFRIDASPDLRRFRIVSAGADRKFEVLPAFDPASRGERRTTVDPSSDVVLQDGELAGRWQEPPGEGHRPIVLFGERVEIASSESLAAHRTTMASMLAINRACEAFKKRTGVYPPGTLERIEAALVPSYVASFPRRDAWGTPFRIESTDLGREIRVVSAGSDRTFEKLGRLSETRSRKPREAEGPESDLVLENGRFVQFWGAVSPTGCSQPYRVTRKPEAPR